MNFHRRFFTLLVLPFFISSVGGAQADTWNLQINNDLIINDWAFEGGQTLKMHSRNVPAEGQLKIGAPSKTFKGAKKDIKAAGGSVIKFFPSGKVQSTTLNADVEFETGNEKEPSKWKVQGGDLVSFYDGAFLEKGVIQTHVPVSIHDLPVPLTIPKGSLVSFYPGKALRVASFTDDMQLKSSGIKLKSGNPVSFHNIKKEEKDKVAGNIASGFLAGNHLINGSIIPDGAMIYLSEKEIIEKVISETGAQIFIRAASDEAIVYEIKPTKKTEITFRSNGTISILMSSQTLAIGGVKCPANVPIKFDDSGKLILNLTN